MPIRSLINKYTNLKKYISCASSIVHKLQFSKSTKIKCDISNFFYCYSSHGITINNEVITTKKWRILMKTRGHQNAGFP